MNCPTCGRELRRSRCQIVPACGRCVMCCCCGIYSVHQASPPVESSWLCHVAARSANDAMIAARSLPHLHLPDDVELRASRVSLLKGVS